MTVNDVHDFFKSESVKKLLTDAYSNEYIELGFHKIRFNDFNVTDDFWRRADMCFVEFNAIKNALHFVDDVINDRFDLHKLSYEQFAHLYTLMIKQYEHTSLLGKIQHYYEDSSAKSTIYVLPEYYTFECFPYYYVTDLTVADAYAMLVDFIEIAKHYKQLEKVANVFYSKIKLVYDEYIMIKALVK